MMDHLGGNGCPELALPALGSDLFNNQFIRDLEGCEIANRAVLDAIRALAFIQTVGGVRRLIDYKNLGSQEWGSVYTSLLELHPILNLSAGTFELQSAAGNERKTTGSYYTEPGGVLRGAGAVDCDGGVGVATRLWRRVQPRRQSGSPLGCWSLLKRSAT
jgi:hypothetical protein